MSFTSLQDRMAPAETTFAREFLPNYADARTVNADLIAQGMAPFSPEDCRPASGRTMLEEIGHLLKASFLRFQETTLSGRVI
jgi:predicted ABC-type ATPase